MEIGTTNRFILDFNYRMTDIQAALGLSQMSRLDQYINTRREIAKHYDSELNNLPLKTPYQLSGTYSSYHLYPICISLKETKKTQKEIYEALWQNDIAVSLHYIPVYLQPYYQSMNFNRGYCPNAEVYFKSAISIPIFVGLSFENQNKIIKVIEKCFK